MCKETTIGIFDSGYGGLSVLLEAAHVLPDARFAYYADTDHVPYGNRPNAEILAFTDGAVDFLIREGADAVIIACNTASAVSAVFLRKKYDLPIIAMEPAVRPALKEDEAARILVMATPVTLREEKLKNLIRREHAEERIDLLAMPKLVEYAENEEFGSPAVKTYIQERISDRDLNLYSAIVLGCTHFNYFKPLLREILQEASCPRIHLIEGSFGTVRRAADLTGLVPSQAPTGPDGLPAVFARQENVRIFCSGRPADSQPETEHIARLLRQLENSRNL